MTEVYKKTLDQAIEYLGDYDGVFVSYLIRSEGLPALVTSALDGDEEAAMLLRMAHAGIMDAAANRTECLCCPQLVRPQLGFAVLVVDREPPTEGAVTAMICRTCRGDKSDRDILDAAMAEIHRIVGWPAMEIIGRAPS